MEVAPFQGRMEDYQNENDGPSPEELRHEERVRSSNF